MAIKFNFNDQRILEGYLAQGIKAMKLPQETSKKCAVGSEGGLIYKFINWNDESLERTIDSADNGFLESIRDYINKLEIFRDAAENYAEKHDFYLVHFNYGGKEIKEGAGRLFETGIGTVKVNSPKEVKDFVKMVNEGYKNFEDLTFLLKDTHTSYEKMQKATDNLREGRDIYHELH